jgi:predicted MFS family arabinose efflux permease
MLKRFTKKEWSYLLVLAGVQFSHILDFVVMMPLGPQLMRAFSIDVGSFSLLVSVYTFAAAISCFIAAFVMDFFDRKIVLSTVYTGLVVGTLLCGIAPSFTFLLIARTVTGIFGGLLQAVILSVLADLIAPEKRGQATGIVLSAFAVSSVVGVPMGLAMANQWGWNSPFILLGLLSFINLLLVHRLIPSLKLHMTQPLTGNVLSHFRHLTRHGNTLVAAALTVSMMTTFAMFPFVSPYLVGVIGIKETQLPEIYLAGGIASLIAAPVLGRLSDLFGARPIFVGCSLLSIGGVLAFTHMPYGSYLLVIFLNMVVAALGSGRMTPYMELLNRSVASEMRGSFMTLIAAVQQLSASAASYVGGMILSDEKGLQNFVVIGWVVGLSMVISIIISFLLRPVQWQAA